jgi:ADP-L-glycero-D-manno-heptose 6-epimerase
MIVITGAAGFIGSVLAAKLNSERFFDLVLSDDFSRQDKTPNYKEKTFRCLVHRDELPAFIEKNQRLIQFVFHLGARTDTTEFNTEIFDRLNLNYSKDIWKVCTEHGIPMVYASSAATYGNGEHGYLDDHSLLPSLKPLNPYGDSKHQFDLWALQQHQHPYFWTGLKFFNVYGPNEYHKGRMASVIFHAFHQIKNTGEMKLFRSHRKDYKDGMQQRDFIYAEDIAEVLFWLMHNRNTNNNGIYNLGSGHARSFLDLVNATFAAMNLPANISFVDIPADIRDTYQYFTEANMNKLKGAGYVKEFTTLEEGVRRYVSQFLQTSRYL